MSKHFGSKFWPITEGPWEVTDIVHVDEDLDIIYFIANKESIFEKGYILFDLMALNYFANN